MKTALGAGIDRLPDRERLVISLYYYEGLTFQRDRQSADRFRVPRLPASHAGRSRLRGYLQRDSALFAPG